MASGNGLAPEMQQAIRRVNDDILPTLLSGTNCSAISIKITKSVLSQISTWKYHLQIASYFVQVSLCQVLAIIFHPSYMFVYFSQWLMAGVNLSFYCKYLVSKLIIRANLITPLVTYHRLKFRIWRFQQNKWIYCSIQLQSCRWK